ncbi:MAG: DUF503 domain-containing protein [bacterium]|nr:DUF503 domain-containing protein [Bacillota bacterium]HHW55995.1 DUF503 domain-containing protein [Bacillota bacterium]
MVIGTATVELYVPGVNSLKDKRRVIKGLLERTRARFNVSVAEVGKLDLWRQATLGLAWVSNDSGHAHRSLQAVIKFLERQPDVQVADFWVRVI